MIQNTFFLKGKGTRRKERGKESIKTGDESERRKKKKKRRQENPITFRDGDLKTHATGEGVFSPTLRFSLNT